MTVGVWALPVPSITAETTLASATVELRVPVATPLAFVGPAGWLSVLPVPVADNTTVAPGIRLPWSSRAVTVMVDVIESTLAMIGDGDAPTVD